MSWQHQRCLSFSTTILGKVPFPPLSRFLTSHSPSQLLPLPQPLVSYVQGFSVSFFPPYVLCSFQMPMALAPFPANEDLFCLGEGREKTKMAVRDFPQHGEVNMSTETFTSQQIFVQHCVPPHKSLPSSRL